MWSTKLFITKLLKQPDNEFYSNMITILSVQALLYFSLFVSHFPFRSFVFQTSHDSETVPNNVMSIQ